MLKITSHIQLLVRINLNPKMVSSKKRSARRREQLRLRDDGTSLTPNSSRNQQDVSAALDGLDAQADQNAVPLFNNPLHNQNSGAKSTGDRSTVKEHANNQQQSETQRDKQAADNIRAALSGVDLPDTVTSADFLQCFEDNGKSYHVILRSLLLNGVLYQTGRRVPSEVSRRYVGAGNSHTPADNDNVSGVTFGSGKNVREKMGPKGKKVTNKTFAQPPINRDRSYASATTNARAKENEIERNYFKNLMARYFKNSSFGKDLMEIKKDRIVEFAGEVFPEGSTIPFGFAKSWTDLQVRKYMQDKRKKEFELRRRLGPDYVASTPANKQSSVPNAQLPQNEQREPPPKRKSPTEMALDQTPNEGLRERVLPNRERDQSNQNPNPPPNGPPNGDGDDGDDGNGDDGGNNDDDNNDNNDESNDNDGDDNRNNNDNVNAEKFKDRLPWTKEATKGNPKDPDEPHPAPMTTFGSKWFMRLKIINGVEESEGIPVEEPLDVTQFDTSIQNKKDPSHTGTVFHVPKVRFSKQYIDKKITFKTYRVSQLDVTSHWKKGGMKVQLDINLYEHLSPSMQKDFKQKLQVQLAQAALPKHKHRLDGRYLDMKQIPSDEDLKSLKAEYLLPYLFICLMPTSVQGTSETAFETLVIELISDEIKYLLESIDEYLKDIVTYLSNYETVTREFFNALAEVDKTIQIMEWWVGEWYPVKKTKDALGYDYILNVMLNNARTGVNLYAIYTLWVVNRNKKHYHSSHLMIDKEQVMMVERDILRPCSLYIQRLLDPPIMKKKDKSLETEHLASKIKILDATAPKKTFIPWKKAKLSNLGIHVEDEELPEDCEEDELNQQKEQPIQFLSADDTATQLSNFVTSGSQHGTPSLVHNMQSQQKPKPITGKSDKACDAQVMRDKCWLNEQGKCPYSHAKPVVKAAKEACIKSWKHDNNLFSCLANINLLENLFDRPGVVNQLEDFQHMVDTYQQPLDQDQSNAGGKSEDQNIDA